MEDKTGLYIVSIVGVVALVAMVIMMTGHKGSAVVLSESSDTTGQVYRVNYESQGCIAEGNECLTHYGDSCCSPATCVPADPKYQHGTCKSA